MTDEEATEGLERAFSFGSAVKKARALSRQTNAILCSVIGISIGSAIPTGLVLAYGTVLSPFIVMGALAGGAIGLLYWRTKANIPDMDETTTVEKLFEWRDRDLAYIDGRLALSGFEIDEAERTALLARKTFYLEANTIELSRHFSLSSESKQNTLRLPRPEDT